MNDGKVNGCRMDSAIRWRERRMTWEGYAQPCGYSQGTKRQMSFRTRARARAVIPHKGVSPQMRNPVGSGKERRQQMNGGKINRCRMDSAIRWRERRMTWEGNK